jgi:thioredoxin reductase (NADPH)
MNKNKRYFMLLLIVAIIALGGCFGVRSADLQRTISMDNLAGKRNLMPIVVIGSGPAGLMAALYGERGGKKTFVIEGNKPGGLLMETTGVENWPGEKLILGPQIISKLMEQVTHQGVTFVADAIQSIDISSWPYKLSTQNGQEFYALTIIIATGASPRMLGVPGEQEYWGLGVTACAVCDGAFFKGEDVVVIGGGDSAVEEAIQLAVYARKVTILVRKGAMRAAASMQNRLTSYDKISIKYNVDIREIVGDGNKVTGIKLYNNETKNEELMPTDGVFLAIGHVPNTSFLKGVVPLDEQGYIQLKGRTQATKVPGIFAAGDAQDHRYRQAGAAAGYGIAAGLDAVRFLEEHGYTPLLADQIKPQLYGALANQESAEIDDQIVQKLTSLAHYEDILQKKGVLFMDFWGQQCPSCKQMLPLFHSAAQQYEDKATFATVDIDQMPELTDKLLVYKVPCLLVYRDGKIIARYTNPMTKKELISFIEQFINTSD